MTWFEYTILNSVKFPGADPKDSSVKFVLPAQNGFKEFLRDELQTDIDVD